MDAARLSRPVLIACAAALVILAATGIVASLRYDGGLPDFRTQYHDHVTLLLERGDKEGALDQMGLILTLGGGDEHVVRTTLPRMASLARELGREEEELRALRLMARRSGDDPAVHERLVTLLLNRPSPSEAEIREAIGHAEHLATRWPESATSWWSLARVTQLIGRDDQSAEFLRRAQAIDPTVRLPVSPAISATRSRGAGT